MHDRRPAGPEAPARTLRRLGDRVTRNPIMAASSRALHASRLRVLAYHDVPDTDAFVAQLRYLVSRYRLVGGDQVSAALGDRAALPRHALWVTFDDGHPDVLDVAEVMADFGVQAALFVCPAVLDTREPFWWQVLEAARRSGSVSAGSVPTATALKHVPDAERRLRVQAVADHLRQGDPHSLDRAQLTTRACHEWVAMGHEIGNHSWDHPCLDSCSEEEQRRQVERAHSALVARQLTPRYFALPNGNRAAAAEAEAARLGYAATLLFDHRVNRAVAASPLSRLRLDADAPVSRARAVVSGAHPWLAHQSGVIR